MWPQKSPLRVSAQPLRQIISIKILVFYILHRYRLFRNKFLFCAYMGRPCLLFIEPLAHEPCEGSIGLVRWSALCGENLFDGMKQGYAHQ